MGFMKPDQGEVNILGMNCFEDAKQVQSQLGYLPGRNCFYGGYDRSRVYSFYGSNEKYEEYG